MSMGIHYVRTKLLSGQKSAFVDGLSICADAVGVVAETVDALRVCVCVCCGDTYVKNHCSRRSIRSAWHSMAFGRHRIQWKFTACT